MKRCWQTHPIGTRVEAGSQIDDQVYAVADLLLDEFVVRISARDPGPCCALAERHGFRDLVAALAREAPRERIAENGIRPFHFAGAVNGREQRGVGDVADERFARAHSDSLLRFRFTFRLCDWPSYSNSEDLELPPKNSNSKDTRS
jgi:hypothetical protein